MEAEAELRQRTVAEVKEEEKKEEGPAGSVNRKELRRKAKAEQAERVAARMQKLVDGAKEHMPPGLVKALEAAKPYTKYVVMALDKLFDAIQFLVVLAFNNYGRIPKYVIPMVYGLFVCFFGAHFAALIAVIEAFKISGGLDKIFVCAKSLYDSFMNMMAANKKDDSLDEDGDGIKDVDELTPRQLFFRKANLVLKTVDPLKVNAALAGLYQCFVSAVVVVRHEFAKTVALGNSIGDFLVRSAKIVLKPVFRFIIPPAYHNWVKLIVAYTCKAIGVSVAWTFQFYQSLIHCAVSGSLIFSRALVSYLYENGKIAVDNDKTNMDEAIGWALAFASILFQATFGTSLPFPLNILLFPLRIVENSLRFSASTDIGKDMEMTEAPAA